MGFRRGTFERQICFQKSYKSPIPKRRKLLAKWTGSVFPLLIFSQIFRQFLSYFPGEGLRRPKPILVQFFSYFGPEAQNLFCYSVASQRDRNPRTNFANPAVCCSNLSDPSARSVPECLRKWGMFEGETTVKAGHPKGPCETD